jgi:hypothetical protein
MQAIHFDREVQVWGILIFLICTPFCMTLPLLLFGNMGYIFSFPFLVLFSMDIFSHAFQHGHIFSNIAHISFGKGEL